MKTDQNKTKTGHGNYCLWCRGLCKYLRKWPRCRSITISRRDRVVNMAWKWLHCCSLCSMLLFCCCFCSMWLFWNYLCWRRIWWNYFWNWLRFLEITILQSNRAVNMTRQWLHHWCFCLVILFFCWLCLLLLFRIEP